MVGSCLESHAGHTERLQSLEMPLECIAAAFASLVKGFSMATASLTAGSLGASTIQ